MKSCMANPCKFQVRIYLSVCPYCTLNISFCKLEYNSVSILTAKSSVHLQWLCLSFGIYLYPFKFEETLMFPWADFVADNLCLVEFPFIFRFYYYYFQVSSPTIIVERAGSYAWTCKSWRIREEFARTVTSAIGLFSATELPLQRAILPPVCSLNFSTRNTCPLVIQYFMHVILTPFQNWSISDSAVA